MAGSGSDHMLQWPPVKGLVSVEGLSPVGTPILKNGITDLWSNQHKKNWEMMFRFMEDKRKQPQQGERW